jgi:hypothetical protein
MLGLAAADAKERQGNLILKALLGERDIRERPRRPN